MNGAAVSLWRIRLLSLCARLLGIPLDVQPPEVTITPSIKCPTNGMTMPAITDAFVREVQRAVQRQKPGPLC